MNPAGAARIEVNGSEFKIKIKCDDADGFKPDYFIVRVNHDDRRFVRGKTNASAANR